MGVVSGSEVGEVPRMPSGAGEGGASFGVSVGVQEGAAVSDIAFDDVSKFSTVSLLRLTRLKALGGYMCVAIPIHYYTYTTEN